MSDRGITEILIRLRQVEIRQYAYSQHDPGCPELLVIQAQAVTGVYLTPAECDCWLSRPSGDAS